jgi:hypothetical protein
MEKLEKLVWEVGNPLPSHIENNFDEKDSKYFQDYSSLIYKFSKTQSLVDLDLTKDFTPPKDLYVEVRANENIDTLKTKNGSNK